MASGNTVEIILQLKDAASAGIKGVENALNGMGKGISSVSSAVFSMQGAIAGISTGLLAKSFVDVNAQFEGFRTTLTTITGSSETAEKSLAWIQEFAAKTPYELDEVTKAFVSLSAYGLNASKDLEVLGNVASAMGKPLQQAVEAMADAVTGEFERLKEFGIRTKTEGDRVTFSWVENGKQMSATSKKTGADIEASLLNIFGDRFKGSMDNASRTWKGMVSNLSDSWTGFLKTVGESGAFDILKNELSSLLTKINEFKSTGELKAWATETGQAVVQVVEAFKSIGTLFTGLSASFGTDGNAIVTAISWIGNAIEQLPLKLQLMVTEAKIGLSELKSAFLEVAQYTPGAIITGAGKQRIAEEAEYRQQLEMTKQTIVDQQTAIENRKFASLNASIAVTEAARGEVTSFTALEAEKQRLAAASNQTVSADRIASAQNTSAQIVTIEKKAIDEYLANLKDSTDKAKTEYELRNQAIAAAEAKGDVSFNQALAQKLESLKTFYNATVTVSAQYATAAQSAYGQDSSQYKKAIEAKLDALNKFGNAEKAMINQLKSLDDEMVSSKRSAEEKIREMKRTTMSAYEAYRDKVKEVEDTIAKAQEIAGTDTNKSIELYKQAMNMASGLGTAITENGRLIVSQNTAVSTATGLVETAQEGIAEVANAQKTAITGAMTETQKYSEQTKSDIDELNEKLKAIEVPTLDIDANGEPALAEIERIKTQLSQIETQSVTISGDNSALMAKIQEAKTALSELAQDSQNIGVTVEFKGKASPELPLTETISNVSSGMEQFQALASKPVQTTVAFDVGAGPAKASIADLQATVDTAKTSIASPVVFDTGAGPARASIDDLKASVSETKSDIASTVVFDVGDGPIRVRLDGVKTIVTETKAAISAPTDLSVNTETAKTAVTELGASVDSVKTRAKTPESMIVDSTPAKAAIDELKLDVDTVKTDISTPASMDIDVSPAQAALRELANEAYQSAIAAEKIRYGLQSALSDSTQMLSGDIAAVIRQNLEGATASASKFTSEYEKLKSSLKEPVTANIKLTGTASPTRPLMETLANVTAGFDRLKSKASEQLLANVGFNMSGLSGSKLSKSISATGGMAGPSKDFGRVEIQVGRDVTPIYGRPDTLNTLVQALRRERLVTA